MAHRECVIDQQAAQQCLADSGDQLDRFGRHHRGDRGAQDPQHTGLRAGRHPTRRRFGVEVAVVEAARLPVRALRCVLPEHRDLAGELMDRAPHMRLVRQYRGVVDQVAGGEVVGAVDDEVVVGEQRDGIVGRQPKLVQCNGDERVDLGEGIAGAVRLGPADIGAAVDDLALQVGLLDDVELDDAQGADPGGGQIEQCRRAQPAGPDHQHPGVLQPPLAQHPDVGNEQVTAVAREFLAGQFRGRGYQRRQGRHGSIVRFRSHHAALRRSGRARD